MSGIPDGSGRAGWLPPDAMLKANVMLFRLHSLISDVNPTNTVEE